MKTLEQQQALAIADRWLDGRMNSLVEMVPGDPDCDACIVARTLVRALDRIKEIDTVVDRAGELVDHVRSHEAQHVTEVNLMRAVDALREALK